MTKGRINILLAEDEPPKAVDASAHLPPCTTRWRKSTYQEKKERVRQDQSCTRSRT